MKRIQIRLLLIIILGYLAGACTPLKDLKYLQQTAENKTPATLAYKYKIQTGDNLYIKIFNISNQAIDLFNSNNQQNVLGSPSGVYLSSYPVNDSGYIQLPIIGSVKVKGKSIDEARLLIESKATEYISNSVVLIKLINFNITVLGEVNRPGQFNIYNDKFTIFDAVGLAGDLTIYGNRKTLKILRTTSEGTTVNYIDLTKSDIVSSPFYYLSPNDVIYIEPLKAKSYGFATFPIATILSSITTLILVLNYIKK